MKNVTYPNPSNLIVDNSSLLNHSNTQILEEERNSLLHSIKNCCQMLEGIQNVCPSLNSKNKVLVTTEGMLPVYFSSETMFSLRKANWSISEKI